MKFIRDARLVIKIRREDFQGYERTIEINKLRISFSITKSLAFSTNSGSIRVWNLNQSTRNLIKDYGDQVSLYAGYQRDDTSQLLYTGDTTSVSHMFDQPDIVSVFECGDGERFLNQLRVSVSYIENSPAKTVIEDIASQMRIPINSFSVPDNLVYRQGFQFIGMGKDGLTLACDKLGLQWSVQNESLQIITNQGTISQQPIFVNQDTGMQGIPQRFTYKRQDLFKSLNAPTTGYKVNVALNPLILPGCKIQLQSTHLGINGPYRVSNVRHEGDTFGFLWSSQIECTEYVDSNQSANRAANAALGR